ncbi:hypothetical protein ACOSP7_023856 [Xanthoceras sorbifolium]
MYLIERYLSTLKRYMRNRAHLEASIAKGYLMEECTNFCSRYLDNVESNWNCPPRNNGRFNKRKGVRIHLDEITWAQAHTYALVNYDVVTPFQELDKELDAITGDSNCNDGDTDTEYRD